MCFYYFLFKSISSMTLEKPASRLPTVPPTRSPQDLCRHRFSCRRWSPQICCCRSEVRCALRCNWGPWRWTGDVSPANMKHIWSKYQSWGSCRWFFCRIRVDHSSYILISFFLKTWWKNGPCLRRGSGGALAHHSVHGRHSCHSWAQEVMLKDCVFAVEKLMEMHHNAPVFGCNFLQVVSISCRNPIVKVTVQTRGFVLSAIAGIAKLCVLHGTFEHHNYLQENVCLRDRKGMNGKVIWSKITKPNCHEVNHPHSSKDEAVSVQDLCKVRSFSSDVWFINPWITSLYPP